MHWSRSEYFKRFPGGLQQFRGFSFFLEKLLEQVSAFLESDSLGDFTAVVQGRMLKEVEQASPGAVLGGGTAENDPPYAHMHQRAGAHGARLLGDVKVAFVQTPVANHAFRLGDRQHLGVRGGILEGFDLVEGAGDDFSLMSDDRPDRDFVRIVSPERLPEGFSHEKRVTA